MIRQCSIVDLTKETHVPKKDDWLTPDWIYDPFNDEFRFDFDPCPYPRQDFDGLLINWGSSNFVNPPFSRPMPWVRKAIEEHRKGKTVVFVHPCNDSTFKLLQNASRVHLLEGSDARFIDPIDRKAKRINYNVIVAVLNGTAREKGEQAVLRRTRL